MILRVIALCVAAAMVSAAMRVQRPELAMAVSLAAGMTAVSMLCVEVTQSAEWVDAVRGILQWGPEVTSPVLKAAGVSILSELGAQLCVDSGESALAGRITLAARIAMLGLCLPLLSEIIVLLQNTLRLQSG